MLDFYVITMNSKNGKTIYFGASEAEENKFLWHPTKEKAIYFDNEYEAQNFRNSYFKEPEKYPITEITATI